MVNQKAYPHDTISRRYDSHDPGVCDRINTREHVQ